MESRVYLLCISQPFRVKKDNFELEYTSNCKQRELQRHKEGKKNETEPTDFICKQNIGALQSRFIQRVRDCKNNFKRVAGVSVAEY